MSQSNQQLIKLEDLHRYDNIEILARQVVEGFIIGLHKSPFHGFSVEFAEHRIYNPGDPIKNIDWKVYGRTDKMFVKRFEEETNLRCQIVIDASSTMYFPEKDGENREVGINKFNFSALSAAALMYMLKKQRDAVGLTLFADEILEHTGARSTTMHHRMLTASLLKMLNNQEYNRKTQVAKCLHQVAETVHKRSLIMIFSDMFETEDQDDLFSALQHLRYNKHEVVLFHVTDKAKELDFEFENRPYQFIDMETGEKVKLRSNQIKDFYKEQMGKYMDELRLRCMQYKIDFVDVDIRENFNKVLLPYLARRSKMSI